MNTLFEKKLPQGYFRVYDQKPNSTFFTVNQVHGSEVLEATTNSSSQDADGLVSKNMTTPLGIKTADCLSIAIIGKKGFANLHAGWRGVKKQIHLNSKVKKLDPSYVFIGPHIKECCFEVKEDFLAEFEDSTFFTKKAGKTYFSLEKQVISELIRYYPGIKVESSPFCTCCHLNFHSFRRDSTQKRNWNLFSLA